MALETSTGPYVITGNTNALQNSETDMGPSVTAMGDAILDPRYVQSIGAAPSFLGTNKVYGH